jgi:hypothetical protein
MQVLRNITWGLLAIAGILSCRKQDDYKKFLAGGEILYTGKADSVQVHPGRNRVELYWLLISDPTIVSSKVYWNNHNDSTEMTIRRTAGIDTIRLLINNLEERTYDFEIVNYDKLGHASMKAQVVGTVYGPLYQSALLNRGISAAEWENQEARIAWSDVDSSTGVTGMQLRYTDAGNRLHDTLIPALTDGQVTVWGNYPSGTALQYRTLYRPDTLAIDTFYTDWETKTLKEDVTLTYLKNPGGPFLLDPSKPGDWRWGQLADWNYNSEAGKRYTYDALNGTNNACLTLWIYYDGTLTNGKIYQTTTLPAGSYGFQATISNIDATLEATYVTVAEGSTLPDVENIAAAAGYYKLKDNTDKLATVPFTLTQPATVTLGFVATMASPENQSLRVSRVNLIRYQ